MLPSRPVQQSDPTLSDAAVAHVSQAWRGLAGDDISEHGSCVVIGRQEGSGIAPAGWVGIVSIGQDTIVSVPRHLYAVVEHRLGGRLDPSLTELENVARILGPPDDVLGPAVLMYAERPRTPPAAGVTLGLMSEAARAELMGACDPAEIDESSIGSPSLDGLVAGYLDGHVVAAAGFASWPGGLGHIGVLTAPRFRERGIGTAVAHAAAAEAINDGLMPQWRAACENIASIRTGLAVGFVEVGRQVSVKVMNDRVPHARIPAGRH
jgi:GNAT superfamily N-acetyltransferase